MGAMSSGDSDGGGGGAMGVVRTVVPDFVRKRFALKFLIVLLVMGLAIGAVGLVGTQQFVDHTRDQVESEYRGLAVQESNLVEQWLESNRLSTRLASGDPAYAGVDGDQMSRTLRNRQGSQMPSDVSAMHLIEGGTGATTFVASQNIAPGSEVDGTVREWVTDRSFSETNQVEVSSVYRTPNGVPVVGFASLVNGTTERVLLVEVSTTAIAGQLQGSDRAEGGFTAVVNGTGTMLIDEKASDPNTNADQTLTTYGDQATVDKAVSLSQASQVDASQSNNQVMNEEYAVGYAPVLVPGSSEDWAVLVHAPTDVLFGDVQQVQQLGLFATAGAVLVMLVIGAALGYNTSSSIDRLKGKAQEMEEGNLDVDIRSGRIDSIGQLYGGFASMRDSLREQIDEAERARKEAEVSRAEAMELSNYLQDRTEEYSEIMQACARGDLTQRMEPEGENEAMDQIAEDFNEMLTELEMTTGQLKTFASEVEDSGRSVQQSAETVRDASEQVADSIQRISDDAYDQKERLQNISEEMDGVAAQLDDFAADNPNVDFGDSLDSIREVASMIEQAADLAEDTMSESENVAGAAEEQAAELNEVSSRAEELTRYAQYLGDGLGNFETEEEHEFVFQTGAGSPGPGGPDADEPAEE
ncbi:MCP domain-containing signal transducer [Halosimplex carlsbadense 2-9-1]|uniref:MCP domain-containing signal transducer n=2 Tax=Halosimplex carlsbadense TaxID=171164 RepID=M0CLW5_9EURY|nr:MCP domain-containing signal transducer [Halosimplex carlsbadense 2-9-1]